MIRLAPTRPAPRVLLALGCLSGWLSHAAPDDATAEPWPYHRQSTWVQTLGMARAAWKTAPPPPEDREAALETWWERLRDDFPVECDWAAQDGGWDPYPWLSSGPGTDWERRAITRALAGLNDTHALSDAFRTLCAAAPGPEDPRWLELYVQAATARRIARLATVTAQVPQFVFTRRRTVRPSFFAYTEGQSDAQNERHFLPGAALCRFEWDGQAGRVQTLLEDPAGVMRDPAVSRDGQRIVFAWKKSLDEDDYHLFELDCATHRVRQLTSGLGFADYEPAFLPNGDLIFASTRCVQTVDCWWTEVSNLYTCDADGRFLRRLGFDQVHTVFPQVLDDGRVIYTRWDYNDRGQVFPQPLFQMHPDGTGQAEFYGNNSWFPTTIAHARGIPGTSRVLAILCGHHTSQAGKLAIIDPERGRHENQGVQLVAPIRRTKAERIDGYGQSGELWQYPYPLNEREFLVGYAPRGWERPGRHADDGDFAIYWMDIEGQRELLVRDPAGPCQQPVPLVARARPPVRPSLVDYRQTTGTYYLQDVYAGAGLVGVPRGTVKRLRVVALEFRAAGIGNNGSSGPGGGALISTPVAVGNGTWDVKVILGETPIQPDGSASFEVPARTPVYFQALDANGHAVQTMRSWSTLQPGEVQACVGCHEHKNSAPPSQGYSLTATTAAAPRALEPFYGPPRGFSFPKEIQPILDRHCVRCHDERDRRPTPARLAHALTRESDPAWHVAGPAPVVPPATRLQPPAAPPESAVVPRSPAFSLLGTTTVDPTAKRSWSDAYLNLTLAHPAENDWDRGSFTGVFDGHMVNWIGSQSVPTPLPPYAAGAARSALFPLLAQDHYGVRLSREEWDKLACWIDLLVPYCGDYTEANAWTEAERRTYERFADKRRRMEALEQEQIEAWQSRVHLTFDTRRQE